MIVIYGSYGAFKVDEKGDRIAAEIDPKYGTANPLEYVDIERIDLYEYCTTYPDRIGRPFIDIRDVGYWAQSGAFTPPSNTFRTRRVERTSSEKPAQSGRARATDKRSRRMDIRDVQVDCLYDSGRAAASCVLDGNRYHVWFDTDSLIIEGPLYKNPPIDLQSGQPGYFPTRRLHITSAFGTVLIARMMTTIKSQGLIELARTDKARKDENERLERQRNALVMRARTAGPKLLELIKEKLAELDSGASDWETRARQLIAEVEREP